MLKLADFGLACEVTEPLLAVCGTPTYVAPEILMETGYSLKVCSDATFSHKTERYILRKKLTFILLSIDRCLGSWYHPLYSSVRLPTVCIARQSTRTTI